MTRRPEPVRRPQRAGMPATGSSRQIEWRRTVVLTGPACCAYNPIVVPWPMHSVSAGSRC